MVYKKLKLEVNNFNLVDSIYIYKKFKNGLDKNKVQYSHFAHYHHRPEDPNPTIRIKFDFIKDVTDETVKGIGIAEELMNTEHKISNYLDWENADIRDWLILSHHLASECVLILVDNDDYYEIIHNLPDNRFAYFIITFLKLLMEKLFNVNIPFDDKYLRYFDNISQKKIFNDYVEECKDRILLSSKGKIIYFANPELRDGSVDFRERFIHFILLCSLTFVTRSRPFIETEDIFYPELNNALNCNTGLESINELCSLINNRSIISFWTRICYMITFSCLKKFKIINCILGKIKQFKIK